MKKYKTLVLFVIGIGLIIAGLGLGGHKQINEMIPVDLLNKLNIKNMNFLSLNNGYHNYSYDFQHGIYDLELSLRDAVINIKKDHVENIKMNVKDANNDFLVTDGDTLIITGGKFIPINNRTTRIEIVVPHDFQFNDVSIDVGAGKLEIDNLLADILNVDVGAGELLVNGRIFKEINVNCGIGNVIIESKESLNHFGHNVDCAIGNVIIGDERYSGIVDIESHHDEKMINIDCGIGNVEIKED